MPSRTTRSLPLRLALVCLVAWCGAAAVHAQQPAVEVLARDLREQVVRIPVTVQDMYGREETRQLPITIFRPPGEGRHPLLVFNHGRSASKRAEQDRYRPEHAARYFVAKGFVVMAPTRIGYWETYGDFDPEQSGSCGSPRPQAMARAASEQVIATALFAGTLPYVDGSRWLVAGTSVGGVTSIATVGRSPAGLLGGINFSGGAGGDPETRPGRPCAPEVWSRYWAGLAKTASAPMLWLYWKNDKYWGAEHPKAWHQAWTSGGGRAEFSQLDAIGEDGHSGLSIDMQNWLPQVDRFLASLGFTQDAVVAKPAASGFAELADAEKVPVNAATRAGAYLRFLEARSPRAFAVGERGAWGWATGDYAHGRALGNCQRGGQNCKLYAVDDAVVWRSN